MNCTGCGRELRVETDGVVTMRRACCDERTAKCSRSKRGSPCSHVVQVQVNPYDANEVLAYFCKEHANMDLYDETVPEDPPPPPQAQPKARPAKVPVESTPREPKPKEPFKSYEAPKYDKWYRRVDMTVYECTACKRSWATNGPSEKCPACDSPKTVRTQDRLTLDLSQTKFLGDTTSTETQRRLPDGTVADVNTRTVGTSPDILVLHGYNTLTDTAPPPEKL